MIGAEGGYAAHSLAVLRELRRAGVRTDATTRPRSTGGLATDARATEASRAREEVVSEMNRIG